LEETENGLSHSWELILTLSTLQNAEHQRRKCSII
jgi:hypothetical protein